MKEFFAENWRFIIYLVVAILGIVITILKKSKLINEIVDTPLERVMSLLPGLIGEAESSFKDGYKKKIYVLSAALGLLEKLAGRELSMDEISNYSDKISVAIESILETPQKKGIVYDEEKKN